MINYFDAAADLSKNTHHLLDEGYDYSTEMMNMIDYLRVEISKITVTNHKFLDTCAFTDFGLAFNWGDSTFEEIDITLSAAISKPSDRTALFCMYNKKKYHTRTGDNTVSFNITNNEFVAIRGGPVLTSIGFDSSGDAFGSFSGNTIHEGIFPEAPIVIDGTVKITILGGSIHTS